MASRAEVEDLLLEHEQNVIGLVTPFEPDGSPDQTWVSTEEREDAVEASRARLLALLAPEQEPSEREIEAGAKSLEEILWRDDGFRVTPYERAKAVLTAARQARQTGGATE